VLLTPNDAFAANERPIASFGIPRVLVHQYPAFFWCSGESPLRSLATVYRAKVVAVRTRKTL